MNIVSANDNAEYVEDTVSLGCEILCDFDIKAPSNDMLSSIMGYAKTLTENKEFMNELGAVFVDLVRQYVERHTKKSGT